MAINPIKEDRTLLLYLDGGYRDGKQVSNTKSYTKIKQSATHEAVHATAEVLASLGEESLLSVKLRETTDLISI